MPSKKIVESAIRKAGKPYRKRVLAEVKNPPKLRYNEPPPIIPEVRWDEETAPVDSIPRPRKRKVQKCR